MKRELRLEYLPPEDWEQFREVIEKIFKNGMPSPFDAAVYGIYDGDALAGFVHFERIFHLNSVYVDEKHRHDLKFSAIIPEVKRLIPKGASVFVLPDKDLEKLMLRAGGRKLESNAVWRFDL